MTHLSPPSNRSLWSDDALRALIAWGKTFHSPFKPDVEWNVWQLALIAESLLAEQSSPPLMETSDAE